MSTPHSERRPWWETLEGEPGEASADSPDPWATTRPTSPPLTAAQRAFLEGTVDQPVPLSLGGAFGDEAAVDRRGIGRDQPPVPRLRRNAEHDTATDLAATSEAAPETGNVPEEGDAEPA